MLVRMKSYHATFIILVALALALASTPCKGQSSDSSFRFSQEWPAAFCYFNDKIPFQPYKCNQARLVNDNFTIHGLWPFDSYQGIMAPIGTLCTKPPYNGGPFESILIKPIKGPLEKVWPSFTHPTNPTSFWNYEWVRHGACSQHILSQSNYFKRAIDLKNKHNIFHILQQNGIVPNDGRYSKSEVSEAIVSATKHKPILFCKSIGTKDFLVEIHLCLDSKAGAFMNCSTKAIANGGCNKKDIIYKRP